MKRRRKTIVHKDVATYVGCDGKLDVWLRNDGVNLRIQSSHDVGANISLTPYPAIVKALNKKDREPLLMFCKLQGWKLRN